MDYKIISNTLAARLKDVLPDLIPLQETAYVANRFILESNWLISNPLEISDKLKINSYLVTIDTDKAFDSLAYDFIIVALKKFGLKPSSMIGWRFFKWQYFRFKKGAW